ncbi:methyltransferase domain-containing protein [Chloroflexota bacterium]
MERKDAREIKTCCATFYQSDIVRLLLGDVFHPGGLELTGYLGTVIGLGSEDKVLDIACGRGASVVYLAKRFGCHVTGLDYGQDNITAAESHAATESVAHFTAFKKGDAEGLPFEDGSFDVVISECSFCTFPDKTTAAQEMARVLRRHGRLGMNDVTISAPLPEDIQSLLAWVACLTGAGSQELYVSILKEVGFSDFIIEDKRDSLIDMINEVRRKLLGVELAIGLGKLELPDINPKEAKHLAQRTIELIESGVIGYTLLKASRN